MPKAVTNVTPNPNFALFFIITTPLLSAGNYNIFIKIFVNFIPKNNPKLF